MSPATAASFLLLGLSLACLKSVRPRLAACSQWLALPALLVSALALFGYAYGVSSLYEVKPYSTMAIHTALCFFVLSLAVLAADPSHGIANIAGSSSAGGVMVRRLLPTLCLALFVVGRLGLAGQRAGLYDLHFGIALVALAGCAVCGAAVVSTALTLRKVDLTRRRAEAKITVLNASLERRVEDRTRELARVSAELTAANAALEQLSLHDALTGLANRRYLDTYLATQLAIARRQHQSLALVLCDVDAFKAFNDEFGHQAGDECLKQVAAALKSCCRRPADMAARYGGEEFALILPGTDLRGAHCIAEAAREAVSQLKIAQSSSQPSAYLSISGGVSVTNSKAGFTAKRLIAKADRALFQAKVEGRNRILSARGDGKSEAA
jgi:diguanylate cyclase (GGDEF)-like protein